MAREAKGRSWSQGPISPISLRRRLTRWGLGAVGLATMVSSGAFAQPAGSTGGYGPAPSNRTPMGQASEAPARQAAPDQPVVVRGADGRPEAVMVPVEQRPVPSPFGPLTKEHEDYIDHVLKFWEASSSKIDRYRCEFRRWEYDPVFGPKDGTARTVADGEIRYQKPDKGLISVTQNRLYTPAETPDAKPTYVPQPESSLEQWVCDGETVYEFNYNSKQLIARQLPPAMRGKAIVDGPLPFMFGASKDKLRARYWFKVNTPPDAKGQYWLLAAPKYQDDAANFEQIQIIIDEEAFLPKVVKIYQRGGSETLFNFENREINWSELPAKVLFWKKSFYDPPTPGGWKRIDEPFVESAPAAPGPGVALERMPPAGGEASRSAFAPGGASVPR